MPPVTANDMGLAGRRNTADTKDLCLCASGGERVDQDGRKVPQERCRAIVAMASAEVSWAVVN
jgi:hypothetical protein